ncbi:MAG: NHL repeat-containing protein [Bacteroidota bacterium]|nr:NHL repeat-containing protein [Bacteroidota bacterium]
MVAVFITLLAFLPDSIPTIIIQSSQQLFLSAVSITINSAGSLFIADQQSHLLFEISENTFSPKKIGGQGWGNTEFDSPCDVTSSFFLDIFVVDQYNRRIQRYDKNLNFIQSFNENTIINLHGRFQPLSCAVSSQGDLFVIDGDAKRLLKINRRSSIVNEFGTYKGGIGAIVHPKDIAVVSNDIIAVLDQASIKLYDVYGNYLRTIILSSDENWKTIQPYNESIIAVSAHSIHQYSVAGDPINRVPVSSIIGFDSSEEFQDAAFSSRSVYILTSTTLYSASLQN